MFRDIVPADLVFIRLWFLWRWRRSCCWRCGFHCFLVILCRAPRNLFCSRNIFITSQSTSKKHQHMKSKNWWTRLVAPFFAKFWCHALEVTRLRSARSSKIASLVTGSISSVSCTPAYFHWLAGTSSQGVIQVLNKPNLTPKEWLNHCATTSWKNTPVDPQQAMHHHISSFGDVCELALGWALLEHWRIAMHRPSRSYSVCQHFPCQHSPCQHSAPARSHSAWSLHPMPLSWSLHRQRVVWAQPDWKLFCINGVEMNKHWTNRWLQNYAEYKILFVC